MSEPIKDKHDLLDLMWDDLLQQESIYRPGPYWEYKGNVSRKLIHRLGLTDFRRTAIGTSYADNVVFDPMDQYMGTRGEIPAKIAARLPIFKQFFELHRHWISAYCQQAIKAESGLLAHRLMDWWKENKATFPSSLEEGCQWAVDFGEARCATYYLRLLSYICVLEEKGQVDFSKVNSIVEVGGGIGVNIHLLLSRYPNIKKVILVDIPTTLYVATQYLRKFFGNSIRDYTETRSLDRISFTRPDDELEILSLCAWQLPKLDAELDLAWNSNSFVEMTREQIGFFCSEFRRLMNSEQGKGVFISYDNDTSGALGIEELLGQIGMEFDLDEHNAESWNWWWPERVFHGIPRQID